MPEVISIVEDDAAHHAATRLQSAVRGVMARRKVDDIRTVRINRMVTAINGAMRASKEEKQGTVPMEWGFKKHKTDEEMYEDALMDSVTAQKALQKLQEEKVVAWTQ